MLELRNIEKYYNPGTINEMCLFDKFNLTVDKGEFVSVVGSNGSGKTSMLNILCGSIPVDGGQILMNGEDITTKKEFKRNQKIGRVYQNPAMGTCPTMTILENMSLADNKGKFFGLSSGINKARKEYYREILSQLGLGLENKMDVKVGSLSGGQRQAIALLMSTMTPIDFLILDEHTAALDPKTAELIMKLTGKIVEEKKLTKYIKLLGSRNDTVELYQGMDAFFLPSFFEGLPVTGVEAQAMGLSMVVSDTVTREMVYTDLVDYVSLNDTPEAWASRLEIALRKNVKREQYADRLKLSNFSNIGCGNRLEQVYCWWING